MHWPLKTTSIAASLLLLWTQHASAQDRWSLVPVTLDGADAPDPSALESHLLSEHLPLLPNAQAAVLVESEHSSDAEVAGPEELERLLALITRGTRELAMGHRRKGNALLKRLESEPAAVRDYLRREPERAQLLFDACMAAAWVEHHANATEAAHQQLQRCVRTFPGLRPSSAPKGLLKLFDKVTAEVAEEPHGHLLVTGREGCIVRLNGTAIGRAPLSIDVHIAPARVQLECDDKPGRIHAVTVRPGANQLSIDDKLDALLRTNHGLQLSAVEMTTAELARVGETLGPIIHARVVLLLPATGGGARLLATHPAKDLGSLATMSSAPTALVAEMQVGTPVPAPPILKPATPQPNAARQRDEPDHLLPPVPRTTAATDSPVWPAVTAGLGLALGLGSITVSWAYYAHRLSMRDESWHAQSYADRDRFHTDAVRSRIFGAAGNLMLASTEYVFLPKAQGVPMGAWLAGGAGVALAAFGAASALSQRACSLPSHACNGFTNDPLFGELVMLHAIPLATVPLNYWLRGVFTPPVRVELGQRSLFLTGAF